MADEVDDVIFQVSAFNTAEDELDQIKQDFLELEGIEESVNPLEILVEAASAFSKIAAVAGEFEALDNMEANPEVDPEMDSITEEMLRRELEFGNTVRTPGLFNNPQGEIGRRDALGIFQGEMNDLSPQQLRRAMFGPGMDTPDTVPDMRGGGDPLAIGDDDSFFDHMRELRDTFIDMKLRMSIFMNLIANLIPLLLTFVAAMPAAIAGVLALGAAAVAAAAGLGAIGGLGLLGLAMTGGQVNVQPLEDKITKLFQTFLDAFGPIAETLQPLAVKIFNSIETALINAGMAASGLTALLADAQALLTALTGSFGPMVQNAILLADSAMPLIIGMLQNLGGIKFFRLIADVLAETLPLLLKFTALVISAIGPIYNLSFGFLTAATALLWLIDGLGFMLTKLFGLQEIMPGLLQYLGFFIGSALIASTITGLWGFFASGLTAQLLALAARALVSVISSIHSYILSATGAIGVTVALTASVLALTAALTFGLAPIVTSLGNLFGGMNKNMNRAMRNLDRFSAGGPQAIGGSTGSGAPSGFSTGNTYNVYAPDRETGMATANKISWMEDDAADSSNTAGRQHTE